MFEAIAVGASKVQHLRLEPRIDFHTTEDHAAQSHLCCMTPSAHAFRSLAEFAAKVLHTFRSISPFQSDSFREVEGPALRWNLHAILYIKV